MKKRVFLLAILVISLIFILPAVFAEENNTVDAEQTKINDAYNCLENKVKDKSCSKLTSEEKIFSLLSIHKCEQELISDSQDKAKCWPKSKCEIKTTAQAILALNNLKTKTMQAEGWLLSQNVTALDIEWLLQIESKDQTKCTINYDSSSHTIMIDESKKINANAGSCLTLYPTSYGGYWLKVSPGCYGKKFETSCDKDFRTTLLFKKKTSPTYHISEKINSASAGGITEENVNSLCFGKDGSCNYEGSLWAVLVLDSLDYDTAPFLPYLVTLADDNEKYMPEVFLSFLTGYSDFRNDLLSKQKSNKYWEESGNKFYDTALALYPFQYETPIEKTNSIKWLLDPKVQGKDGCWDSGNIVNNGFLLFSIWPKAIPIVEEGKPDCESSNYYCMSSMSCQEAGGNILNNYECSSVFECCDKAKSLDTCADMGGKTCNSNEACLDGRTEDAADLDSGQTCCLGGGYCEEKGEEEKLDCTSVGGQCREICEEGEGADYNSACMVSTDTCCIKKTGEKKSLWWIWILLFLIILTALGIIFRDKLRPFWFKIKSKFGKSGLSTGAGPRRPGFPPGPMMGGVPPRRMMPMRPLPQPHNIPAKTRPFPRPAASNKTGELDDVLKKLKDMSK